MRFGSTRLLWVAAILPTALTQSPTQIKLPAANASLGEEFTAIGSVRELSDGRVLITDPRENRVVVADLKTGAIATVGRQGKGPNEFGNAFPLLPLGGDSSLMNDILARRWLLFSGATIVATVPPDHPLIVAMKGWARGADARGYVFTTVSPQAFDQEKTKPGVIDFGPADSEFVVRGHRGAARLDTVTKIRAVTNRQIVTHTAQGKFQSVSNARPPLAVGEVAVLFQDGWFAVARLDPYRVDWISPDGQVRKGKPIPVARLKFSAAEREAYIERRDRARAAAAASGPAIPSSMLQQSRSLQDEFPEYFPPFFGVVFAGGDGNLWLTKPVSKDHLNPRYDVVDRSGGLLGTVTLGPGERIVSVSRTAVYVVWKDQDDIERLRRHPWSFAPVKGP